MTSLIVRYCLLKLLMMRDVTSGLSSEFLTLLDCSKRRPRGCRAGVHVQVRRASLNLFTNNTNRTPGAITVLLGNIPSPRATARRPTSAFVRVARVAQPTSAMVAVFNAQLIGNKFEAIRDRITVEKPCFCAIVEIWHDWPTAPASSHVRPLATIALRGLARVQKPKSTACLSTMEASVYYTRAGMAPEPCRCQPTRRSRCSRRWLQSVGRRHLPPDLHRDRQHFLRRVR